MSDLADFYGRPDLREKMAVTEPLALVAGQLVAAVYINWDGGENCGWHRARVVAAADPGAFALHYIDYGTVVDEVDLRHIRHLHRRFAATPSMPALAIPCRLHGIRPRLGSGDWSEAAFGRFRNHVLGDGGVFVEVKDATGDGNAVGVRIIDGRKKPEGVGKRAAICGLANLIRARSHSLMDRKLTFRFPDIAEDLPDVQTDPV